SRHQAQPKEMLRPHDASTFFRERRQRAARARKQAVSYNAEGTRTSGTPRGSLATRAPDEAQPRQPASAEEEAAPVCWGFGPGSGTIFPTWRARDDNERTAGEPERDSSGGGRPLPGGGGGAKQPESGGAGERGRAPRGGDRGRV